LLVAFGEQRERFANAAKLQRYAGIAPVTKRSGQTTWIHWRWQCSTFLRQTFVEWARRRSTSPTGLACIIINSERKAVRTRQL